jgi:acetyl-CoA synthetase
MPDEIYPVPPGFAERARVNAEDYDRRYRASIENPEAFWAEEAKFLNWIRPFSRISDTSFDARDLRIRWFEDGTLNASVNCLDRHLPGKADRPAILWEGDAPGESRVVTWGELADKVNRLANVLKSLGVA